MLGIFLLYFIVTHINKISDKYGKKKWPPAVLSIVIYYGAGLFFGISYGLIMELTETSIDSIPELVLNLIGIPIGLLAVWLFGKYLNNKWSKETPDIEDKIETFGTSSTSSDKE